jgi:hypothetical protein
MTNGKGEQSAFVSHHLGIHLLPLPLSEQTS